MTRKCRLYAVLASTLQLLHAAIFVVGRHTTVLSNILQAAIALATAWICMSRSIEREPSSSGRQWRQLTAAFLIWTVAQVLFTVPMLTTTVRIPTIISTALWLLFPFPLLVVASKFSNVSQRQMTSVLDIAQASVFFSTLFLLVLMKPSAISLTVGYEVQSAALALACLMRYSMNVDDQERRLHRDLAIFASVYAVLSIAGYEGEAHGLVAGTATDLCWTIPFTVFSLLALLDRRSTEGRSGEMRIASAKHLHGITAAGLAVMSLSAAGLLAFHHPVAGGMIVATAFILFAASTGLREWHMHTFQSRLQHAVFHDSLTGLGNRIFLEEELARRLESRDHASTLSPALMFIDIDRFKSINDSLGHTFGDRLLRQVASLLIGSTRSNDMVIRHGGDEFVVLLDQVNEESARALAERILTLFRRPFDIDGRSIHISASIGLVLSHAGDTPELLLQNADCAMFKAKLLGKDRMQLFTPDLLQVVKEKQALTDDLRRALDLDQISIHYQPIFELKTNALHGFEALARWNHPERGSISPADFIPIAEETGLIAELGRQILRKACIQCQAWNHDYKTSMTMSVNVSPYQLSGETLLADLATILAESGLAPSLLKLEMTESALINGEEKTGRLLEGIRRHGVSLSLDDFGTGYSSLSYLVRFPFDIIKIDRSFIHGVHQDRKRAETVRAIIHMAAGLNMKVIAEGIEVVEEHAHLKRAKCDMVQGYLLSKPLQASEVEAKLLAKSDPVAQEQDVRAKTRTHIKILPPKKAVVTSGHDISNLSPAPRQEQGVTRLGSPIV